MDVHVVVHALRGWVARLVDALSHADSWRLFGGDPAVTVSSVCRHAWFPSPGGPAEYCGRCGAVRPRTSALPDDARDAELPSEPPRPVGPVGWPDAGLPGATSTATAAAHGRDEGDDLDVELVEPAPPTARAVGPRVTRPGLFGGSVVAAAEATVDDHRSFIRTATVATVLLSLGALVGFLIADTTRDTRDVRGVAAVSPTGTPDRVAVEPSLGVGTVGPTSTPLLQSIEAPTPTTAPPIGPAMAPPVARLGDRLTSGGIQLTVAWQPPIDGSTASRYDLGMARDSGSYRAVGLDAKTSLSARVSATADHAYAFRLRARGKDGTEGPSTTATVRLTRIEESGPGVQASKGWKIAKHPNYTGEGARYSSTAGAELSLSFDGTGVAIIGPEGPGRGRADVFIDGRRAGRFDALASTFGPTRLLFRANGLTPGPHVLSVRVAGTPGRPMVAVDRVLVLGQP